MGGAPMTEGMVGQSKQGMMGPGMMQGGMGSGMMQGGMGSGGGGIFGSRVKVGDIKSEDGTITADIVTIDNSLVQRLKVDRHTGAIEYQN